MTKTLLPCPFCGGEAVYNGLGYEFKHKKGCFYLQKGVGLVGINETATQVIEAWNRRAERTCENIAGSDFECSECGCSVYGGDELGANIMDGSWNYCPNCGAKVIGD